MHRFDSQIRYSEVDAHHRLRIDALVNYLQDTAVFETDATDYSMAWLKSKGLGWMVNYWMIDIEDLPKIGESISITSFPYGYRHFLSFRNHQVENGQGETIIQSHSVWSMMDLESGRPVRVPEETKATIPPLPKLDMEYTDRKIVLPKIEGKDFPPILTTPSMLDENQHMNNVHHIRIAQDLLAREEPVRQVRVEYKNQAFLGDELFPTVYQEAGSHKGAVALRNKEGEDFCLVEMSFEES